MSGSKLHLNLFTAHSPSYYPQFSNYDSGFPMLVSTESMTPGVQIMLVIGVGVQPILINQKTQCLRLHYSSLNQL